VTVWGLDLDRHWATLHDVSLRVVYHLETVVADFLYATYTAAAETLIVCYRNPSYEAQKAHANLGHAPFELNST
jgi:hypothetical protein